MGLKPFKAYIDTNLMDNRVSELTERIIELEEEIKQKREEKWKLIEILADTRQMELI